MAGTSRTRPPTQYADTFPSSQSITASGPFSKRGSTAAAVVFFATAFFAPGRREDVGLAALLAVGRSGGAAAGAAIGSGAGPVNVFGTADTGAASGKRAARPSSSRA
ncbi:hypothetical protein [Streptomyces sp. NPDC006510]|uniref:hypothetical protein n=1 Tax=Streptomyces sp. NPDC006510 TaxID=3155600 RepID=UPI0033A8E5B1